MRPVVVIVLPLPQPLGEEVNVVADAAPFLHINPHYDEPSR